MRLRALLLTLVISAGILTPAVEAKTRTPKTHSVKRRTTRKAKKFKPTKVKKARRSAKPPRVKPRKTSKTRRAM